MLKRLKHGGLAGLVGSHQNRLGLFDLEPPRVTDTAIVLDPHLHQSHRLPSRVVAVMLFACRMRL